MRPPSKSYKKALKIAINHCPEFGSATFMIDFEKSEHIAIRTHLPNSVIKGCLFNWKQHLCFRIHRQ